MLRGGTVQAIDRRAKYLVFTLHGIEALAGVRKHTGKPAALGGPPSQSDGHGQASTPNSPPTLFLLIHLKMSGKLSVVDGRAPIEKHDRVVFDLDNGQQLRFNDVRKFGKMWAVIDPEEVTGSIGPEPLAADFSLPKFRALVKSRSGAIKPLLLDQTFLAGLGNIYVDESLWSARLHPLRTAESLTRGERVRLYHAIQRVLKRAVAVGGTSIDIMYKRVNGASGGFQDSLRAFDRENRPCRRCGTPIQKTVVGQRGTHFCPTCQELL